MSRFRSVVTFRGLTLLLGGAAFLAGCSAHHEESGNSGNHQLVLNLDEPDDGNAAANEPNSQDPALFKPLRSAAVKEAIHHALASGQTQRWQDGALSGYAVPSQTPGANGCRAVRYTVDQRSSGNFESITACDLSAAH